MAWAEDLSVIEVAALEALADACKYSLSAHVPEGAILRKTKSHLRGDMSKGLKNLVKKGLCGKHPTGGNMTYELTPIGRDLASRIFGR